jgi:hypothetical protein
LSTPPDAGHQFLIFRNESQARFRIIGTAIVSEIRKGLTMLDIRLVERGREKPGKTTGGLATAMGVRPGAVSEILSGKRLIKASEIADHRILAQGSEQHAPFLYKKG